MLLLALPFLLLACGSEPLPPPVPPPPPPEMPPALDLAAASQPVAGCALAGIYDLTLVPSNGTAPDNLPPCGGLGQPRRVVALWVDPEHLVAVVDGGGAQVQDLSWSKVSSPCVLRLAAPSAGEAWDDFSLSFHDDRPEGPWTVTRRAQGAPTCQTTYIARGTRKGLTRSAIDAVAEQARGAAR